MLTTAQFNELAEKFSWVTGLKSYFEGVRNDIDQKVVAKENEVDAFINDANSRIPRIEITKNMEMRLSSFGGIEGFGHYGHEITILHRAINNVSVRAPIEDALILMIKGGGSASTRYINRDFNIIKLKWSGATLNSQGRVLLTGIHYSSLSKMTTAAFILPVSGELYNDGLSRGIDNSDHSWQLCGEKQAPTRGVDYTGNHINATTTDGEIYIALAGVVTGDIDLTSPENWGITNLVQKGHAFITGEKY